MTNNRRLLRRICRIVIILLLLVIDHIYLCLLVIDSQSLLDLDVGHVVEHDYLFLIGFR